MTTMHSVNVGNVKIGPDQPLAIISGPCVAESYDLCMRIGETVRDRCAELGLGYIFKASFDKANRSSIASFRGPGMDEGFALLGKVGSELGVPVTTDIHEPEQAEYAAHAVQLLQIPAFLCRQTDLLVAAARTGKPVNVKKGQFISPNEMSSVVDKLTQSGAQNSGIILTERGTFFGYQRLVNDFIGVADMMDLGWPVCFDVTHSTQLPGAGSSPGEKGTRITAGRRDRAPMLARCATVAGVQVLFMETHPTPDKAMSDSATTLPLEQTIQLLGEIKALRDAMGA